MSENLKPVRLASIGAGMIGKVHAKFAAELPDCEYVALCDPDPSREQMARELGTEYYSDYKEMIEKESLDGVIVSLPNEMHEPVGTYCADRGLHIFMEKPIAPTIETAKKLIESAKRNNVQLLIAHHRRFNPMIVATRDMVQSGELGDIVGVSILWCMYKPSEYFVAGPWRAQKGGGPILINTIHEVDNLRFIYGEIERVYAEVSNKTRGFEVEDTVSITVRFIDGTLASILMSDAAPSLWGYECTMGENPHFFPTTGNIYHYLGTKASLTFPGMKKVYYQEGAPAGWQHPITEEQLDIKSDDPYPDQIRHFCRVITGEETPRTSGEDGLRTLQVTMAIHESGMTNLPVTLKY
ncbi:MAG: Gfo/Idh/MocA family oxidoreductase [Deltaproteobacteria bacterium]|jgi:predicted dehydrogenase|nr:Gfo/Idh/MocA family oxidoreductase [Deltaproteobacteria bacterium]MBT4526592.1 Gfo/Idh/MocA family oxidoreductase [Deltaproteobacteria bacterium]